MYQSNPISFSFVLLSHVTAISVCTAWTEFVVALFVVALVFSIIKFNVTVILNFCIAQETTIRGK